MAVTARLADARRAVALNLRQPNLRAAQLSFALAWTAEWAFTVGVGIAAFRDAGTVGVGLVGVLRMLPAAVVAPLAAPLGDRFRRERVLAVFALVRAVCAGGVAVVVAGGVGPALYVLAAVTTIAGTLFRPLHSALMPSLCSTAQQLAAANVTRGLLDSVATFLGPLLATVLLDVGSLTGVFVAAAIASGLSAPTILLVRYDAGARQGPPPALHPLTDAAAGVRAIVRERPLVVLFLLVGAQTLTRGALTVLTVVLAIDQLGLGETGVGSLTTAIGAGAVIGSLLTLLLAGSRRLGAWFAVGVTLWGLPLVLTGAVPAAAFGLLAVVGAGNALVDLGGFTLPARLVTDDLLARVFGVLESIVALSAGLGALVAPPLVGAFGVRGAAVAVGVVCPAAVLLSWPILRRLDTAMVERDRLVALLAGSTILRPLPMPAIENLARRLEHQDVPAGSPVVRQGEAGDAFFVIERGEAAVEVDGAEVRRLGSPAAFGEVALLRDGRRTATVRAVTDLHLRTLRREQFVAVVRGYARSHAEAQAVIAGLWFGQDG